MQEGPDQTAYPCKLIDAITNHFMTRVTNKLFHTENVLLHLGCLFPLKMSFKILISLQKRGVVRAL